MAKSPKSRSRESRSQKSRTGATRWAQLGEKKRDNKQRVAEANKLKKAAVQEERKKKKEDVDASETVILQTPSGRSLRVLDVYGYGKCAMLVVWALYKITGGMPYDEVAAAVSPTGGITQELADELQRIREAVADVPDADLPLKDGEESQALEHVLRNSFHQIETKEMFRTVALLEDGYLGPLAMRLAARHLGLNGLRVVQLMDGSLVGVDGEGKELADTDVNLALYDGWGHFKALIPTTPVSTDFVPLS